LRLALKTCAERRFHPNPTASFGMKSGGAKRRGVWGLYEHARVDAVQ
jgi:hypothetical protein